MPGAILARPRAGTRSSYSPYGSVHPTSQAALAYCGEHRNPITRYYHLGKGHRIYSPVLMRFLSPDYLSPFAAGGLNAFAYCLGDPINHRDPTGQKAEDYLLPVLSILTNALGLFISGLRIRSLQKQSMAARAHGGALATTANVLMPDRKEWMLSLISATSAVVGLTVAVSRTIDPGRDWQMWALVGLTGISVLTTGYEAWSLAQRKPWAVDAIELQRQVLRATSPAQAPPASPWTNADSRDVADSTPLSAQSRTIRQRNA